MTSKVLSDAFYRRERADKMLYMFWSKDWFSSCPWTYNLEPVKYFDRREEIRPIGVMTVRYYGPLCIVTYEVNKDV